MTARLLGNQQSEEKRYCGNSPNVQVSVTGRLRRLMPVDLDHWSEDGEQEWGYGHFEDKV